MIKILEKTAKRHPILLDELAHLYLDSGWTEKAMKTVDKHLKKFPDSVTGMLVKALIHEEQGEFVESENLYREILNREPRNIRAITRLAVLENDKSDASDYWKKCLAAVDPLCPWIQAVKVRSKTPVIGKPIGLREESLSAPLDQRAATSQTEPQVPEPAESVQKPPIEPPESLEQPPESEPVSLTESDQQLEKDLQELEKEDIAGQPHADDKADPETMEKTPESLDTPPEQEILSDDSFAPSASEISELQRVYQEITENTAAKTGSADTISQKNFNTVTIARLYAEQGNIDKALTIFNALPEDIKAQYFDEIQRLENLSKQGI